MSYPWSKRSWRPRSPSPSASTMRERRLNSGRLLLRGWRRRSLLDDHTMPVPALRDLGWLLVVPIGQLQAPDPVDRDRFQVDLPRVTAPPDLLQQRDAVQDE